MLNPFAISSLLVFVTCFFIGIFVYSKKRNDKAAVVLSFFSLLVAYWGWGGFKIATTHSREEALFWWKIAFLGIVSPVVYAHFVFNFLNINRKFLLFAIYSLAVFFIGLAFFAENAFLGNLRFVFNQFYWIEPKSIFYFLFYISIYWILLAYFFLLLVKAYRKSVGHKKQQLKYILLGSFFGWFGGHCNFLPSFGIDIYPYPNFLVVVYVLIFTYAILRHQLLDIEVIIKKTLLFTGIFALVYAIFAFFALLGQIFFERFITQNRWIAMIPSVVVVTIMLRPLENFLTNVTDKYLFQKKYSYKELLKTFTSEVLTVLDLERLLDLTQSKLKEIMKLEYCKVILTPKDINVIEPNVALSLPVTMHNQIIGKLLLGKKKSDEEYTQDDLDILQPLSKTLGIAITNARLLDELSKTQAEVAQKDKMATIGTLAAGMAHEIRNPVTTIRVFSEYVPDRLGDSEFKSKYRNVVVKEVDKIDHIIQTLIDFSGEDALPEADAASIYDAIQELLSMVTQNQEFIGRIEFINNVSSKLSKIHANKEELDEIILNLTQNAIHAIEGNGAITFTAEEKDKSVILEIADTGSGMSEETAKHIFDPFFTTRAKGHGLGLFVVRELVERNKGKISVKSVMNKGTKFGLEFKRV